MKNIQSILVPGYIEGTVLRRNEEELHLDEHVGEPGFLGIRVYSRHRNGTRYQLCISYKINDCNDNENDYNENNYNEINDNENDDNNPI